MKNILCWLAGKLGGCADGKVITPPVMDSFMPEEEKSDFPVYTLPWAEVQTSLLSIGLMPMEAEMPDVSFFSTHEEYWRQLLKHLTYPSRYFPDRERKDCDDYSKKASADSSFYFGLDCLQVRGNTPIGYHAFNMVMVSPGKWKVFEPDAGKECAGQLLDLDNKFGWRAEKWKP